MQKYYLFAVVFVVALGVGSIVFLDHAQPASVNVELTNKIIGIITAVLPILLLQLSNSAKIESKGEEVKQSIAQPAAAMAQSADDLKNTASQIAAKPVIADVTLHTEK